MDITSPTVVPSNVVSTLQDNIAKYKLTSTLGVIYEKRIWCLTD